MSSRAPGRDRLLAIVGPTASGKTGLAMRIADALPAEIIGADSRQVYRRMDIGTAKPTPAELAAVPHHLVNVVDPDDGFSLRQYIFVAKQAIQNVNSMGNLPILVGGTGQYVMAILEGWRVPTAPPDAELRRRLESRGLGSLVAKLRDMDANAADEIDLRNPRRVIRAIERASVGHPASERARRAPPDFDAAIIGLTAPRQRLYERADRRFDEMIESGFVEEVRTLLDAGYGPELPAMSGIGYSEIADHLLNGAELSEAAQRAKYRTHRYIRQQANWYRADDDRIRWFDLDEVDAAAEYAIRWAESHTST